VRRLTRTAIGPVQLQGLEVGAIRELTLDELGVLLDSAQL
jgi:23S rRNA pseudouridine2605 synthase